MKKNRVLLVTLVIALSLMLVVGCSSPAGDKPTGGSDTPSDSTSAPDDSADQPAKTEKVKIGMSLGNVGDVFDRLLYNGVMDYAEEHKDTVELMVLDAKGEVNTQIANVEQLINSKVDTILLWPYEKDALTVSVELANSKNIPVVCVNTLTSGGEFIYVGSDDVEAGRIQGEWLAEHLPENATYVYLMGPIGHSGQIGRKQGLEEVLSEKRPDIKMLAEQTGMWDRDKGLKITEDWLKAFPDVTAIVSQNDNMALGAVEALRTVNKIGEIIVVGVDATEEACMHIKAGELDMSVFQNAYMQGYKSIEVAVACARGEWDGEDYIIPFEPVDETNVQEYLDRYAEVK